MVMMISAPPQCDFEVRLRSVIAHLLADLERNSANHHRTNQSRINGAELTAMRAFSDTKTLNRIQPQLPRLTVEQGQ
jgi:hypothetical protein